MNSSIKSVLQQFFPHVVWNTLRKIKHRSRKSSTAVVHRSQPRTQDLDVYWSDEMSRVLETWGTGNVWHEITFLLANCRGKVLDIACGTGKTMQLNSELPGIELHGCDISDFLIQKAIDRGIEPSRLKVANATKMEYADDSFDYSYSIGSLEHFTEQGIRQFIAECHRVTRVSSFHMMPVSRSGTDEGWMKTEQSFFNNSVGWWLAKFEERYPHVTVVDSLWADTLSVGKWFVCAKG